MPLCSSLGAGSRECQPELCSAERRINMCKSERVFDLTLKIPALPIRIASRGVWHDLSCLSRLIDVLKMTKYKNSLHKELPFLQSMDHKESQVQTQPSKDHLRDHIKCEKVLQETNEKEFSINDSIFLICSQFEDSPFLYVNGFSSQ